MKKNFKQTLAELIIQNPSVVVGVSGFLFSTAGGLVSNALNSSNIKKHKELALQLYNSYSTEQKLLHEQIEDLNTRSIAILRSLNVGTFVAGAAVTNKNTKVSPAVKSLAAKLALSPVQALAMEVVTIGLNKKLDQLKNSYSLEQNRLYNELVTIARKNKLMHMLGTTGGVVVGSILGESLYKLVDARTQRNKTKNEE